MVKAVSDNRNVCDRGTLSAELRGAFDGPSGGVWTRWCGAGGILLLVLACYFPALGAGFVWDDDWWVTDNPAVQSWGGIWKLWTDPTHNQQYYPLTATSFWLECRLWGLRPFGYHLTNVLLHAANAVLVWLLLRRLGVGGAWAAAAIFAVHPLEAESVAWITERKNVLSTLFVLITTITYLRHVESPTRGRYAAAMGFILCALLSKTAACMLAPALWVILWWKRARADGRRLAELVPFFVLGALAGAMTAWLEVRHAGAAGEPWLLTWPERVTIAGRAVWFYVGKLVWPQPLMFVYPRWNVDPSDVRQFGFAAAGLVVLFGLWLGRRRIGRGLLAAGAIYAILLFPALGFFDVFFMRYSFVQDHFQYAAGIAVIAGVVALCSRVLTVTTWSRRMAAPMVLGCILVTFGALTWTRAQAFHDSETLWRDSLSKNAEAWLPHNNLGVILDTRGEVAEAIRHYRAALRVRPAYFETHINLGDALIRSGSVEEGLASLRRALELNANLPDVHTAIGLQMARMGKTDEAIEAYRAALTVHRFYAAAHLALGDALLKSGRFEEAVRHFEEAVRRRSPFASDYNNLANLLVERGRGDEALGLYRRAIEINPDYADALFNLGRLLNGLDDKEGALDAFQKALDAGSQRPEAYYNVGTLLYSRRDYARSALLLRRAVELRPEFAEAHHNLAISLFQIGDYASAWQHAHEARKLGQPPSDRFLEDLRAKMPEPGGGR